MFSVDTRSRAWTLPFAFETSPLTCTSGVLRDIEHTPHQTLRGRASAPRATNTTVTAVVTSCALTAVGKQGCCRGLGSCWQRQCVGDELVCQVTDLHSVIYRIQFGTS